MKIRNRIAVLTLSLIMAITYMPAMAFAETGEAETGSQQTEAMQDSNAQAASEETDLENSSDVAAVQNDSESAGSSGTAEGEKASEDNTGANAEAGTSQTEAAADSTANEETADNPEADAAIDKSEMISKKLTVDIGDSDELLEEYFERQFDVKNNSKPGLLRASKLPRREKLSEAGKAAYDEMLPQIKAIAAGTQREPVVTYNSEDFGEGDDAFDILTAMAIDYPYEFYWYDKTQTVHYNAYRVIMPVAEAYRGELIDADYEIYALDTAKIASANHAADNARAIVDKYRNFNDFSKLRNYKNEICDLNEYNQAAADDWDTPYGDPWQMIYVFDGDPETKVVCEGYSKAFQFLCDNSKFQSDQVECFTVTGAMVGGDWDLAEENYGIYSNHMWNVLRMDDGKVYIADITNADVESTAQSNTLFLGGAMPYDSYKLLKFSFYGDGADISYAYDQDTIDLYDESELAVSTSPYQGVEHEHKPGEVIYEVYFEPTCTAGGYHDEVVICDSCNQELSRETIYDPPLGHTEKVIEGYEPTCTETGLTDGKECTVCDTVTQEQKVIPAKGHTEQVISGHAPTCTGTGLTDGKVCSVCGVTTVEQEIIPELGHDWDEGVVTKNPTAEEEGIRVHTCSRCEDTYEESIQAGITELTAENVEVTDVVYTGAALEPEVTVTVDGTVLTEGRDYEVVYSNNINAGTGTVTVTGIVSYSGEVTASFKISPKAITPAVTLSTVNYTWNGKVKTPAVTVKYGSKVLKNGTDYNVTYQAGRKNIGRYSVTVTLKGNYSGKKAATFNINPKGTTAYKPKAAKKAFTAKWKKLTTKMPKAKVTGYQVQYSTNKTFKTGAKTVTVKGATKTSRKISGLKKTTTYYVRVRTYMSVGGRYYYSTWSAVKSVRTK